MESRSEKNIYTYYKGYTRDLIDCVYNAAASINMKKIFMKKWGTYLTGTLISTLSNEEKNDFEKYADMFEKYLSVAKKLQNKGYNFEKIRMYFINQKAIQNTKTKRKNTVAIYPSFNAYLEKYEISRKEMDDILETVSTSKRMTFMYLYGINRPKKSIEEIANMLNGSENLVLAYIKAVEEEFEKYQLSRLSSKYAPPVEAEYTWKSSVYAYFDPIEYEYVTQVIEYYRENKYEYFSVLIKAFGKKFDRYNPNVKLTEKEISLLNCIIGSYLPRQVNEIKAGVFRKRRSYKKKDEKVETQPKTRGRKNSLYDYFKEEDKEYVTQVIEWYKEKKKKYYDLIVKVYGENYDKLNEEAFAELTDKEKVCFWNIRNVSLPKYVEQMKNGTFKQKVPRKNSSRKRKNSFYDYFKEEDKEYVTQLIEWYKENTKKYYDLIVKLYGENYDKLNQEIVLQLSEEEKKSLWYLQYTRIPKYVEQIKNGTFKQKTPRKTSSRKRKTSFYDYFKEEDKKYVTQVIEWYKENKKIYYDLIVKVYGENYDKLNEEVARQLTNEEKKSLWYLQYTRIPKYVEQIKNGTFKLKKPHKTSSRKRKNSFYDYFKEEDKEYVTQVIEWYKEKKKKYYDLIVKLYGETYDKLNEEAFKQLTDEEKTLLSRIRYRSLSNYIKQIKDGTFDTNKKVKGKKCSKTKESFYDYFEEEDKEYVTQVIEWYKQNNRKYYDLIVKLYGETYDKLNEEAFAQLTDKEKVRFWNIRNVSLPNYISQIKNGTFKQKKLHIASSLKRKNSFYDYFKEEDKLYVTQVIEWYKENKKIYYDLIVKVYGENYDKLNKEVALQLTNEEKKSLCYLQYTSIPKYVEQIKNGTFKPKKPHKNSSRKRKNSFYDYFEEEDKEYITQVIEYYKENKKNYYDLIVKLFGETYDKLNEEAALQLTKEEKKRLENIRGRSMKNYISQIKNGTFETKRIKTCKKEKTEKEVDKISLEQLDATTKELVILQYKSEHFNIDDEKLCKELNITMEELDCCYSKYLHLFKTQIPNIIRNMIVRDVNNVSRILSMSYLNPLLQTLTLKEKIYLQLKLESYANPNLTDEKIATLVGVAEKDLKDYQIMSSFDELNDLNVLLKK